jgi:DNA-damage-inducible protein D
MESTELDPLAFEQAAHVNGDTCWYAREYAAFLGYTDYNGFHKGPVDRAIAASLRAGIPVGENFGDIAATTDALADMKLSRFACFLIAMNADSKKPQVARVQAYLAGLADSLQDYLSAPEQLDRIVIRGEISDGEKSLASTAKGAGIDTPEGYAFFQNAGYRGMYNVNLNRLREIKGVPLRRSPLDFMHSTELAANLFRITQTDAKIQNERVTGQKRLEQTASEVGRTVRQTMIKLSNTRPEDLPAAGDINDARSALKQTHRSMKRLDRPRRQINPGKTPSVE